MKSLANTGTVAFLGLVVSAQLNCLVLASGECANVAGDVACPEASSVTLAGSGITLRSEQATEDHILDGYTPPTVVLHGSVTKLGGRRSVTRLEGMAGEDMRQANNQSYVAEVPQVDLFKMKVLAIDSLPCQVRVSLGRLTRVAYDPNLRRIVWKRMMTQELWLVSSKNLRKMEAIAEECRMPLTDSPRNTQRI